MQTLNNFETADISGGWVRGIVTGALGNLLYETIKNFDTSGGQTNTNTDPMGNMS